ncbi:hypothetical protein GCM10022251_24100 [Phytohabitans flavus]|uniref:eCIS core domain-containing protein n=1 Tax=Phytohabitans flavus TaxID=1076124 RepID=A0A6F8XRD7_9ACTN|nr:DUF4157 domain-containing protein [Phytohabitans flavus]BCB76393.1 hypothetical protein Pflav_028030 [Phytohabitans flavus]
MKSSVREPLTDGPASEPVRAVAPLARTQAEPAPPTAAPAPPTTAFAGSNAAIQRLVSGRAPRAAPLGVLSAGGNRAMHHLHRATVQPKLSVSQPGDRFERQADAVAAQVTLGEPVAGPAPTISRLAAPSAAAGDPGPPGLEALLANPGPGTPIPPDVRAQIEPHLGFALGDVQVHSNTAAQLAAAQLGARAFTSGGHIFLGSGESATDLPLMAHEATHVVQQQTVGVYRLQRSSDSILPDFIMDGVRDLARSVPGYDMLTVVAGYDPIANRTVDRSPENLVRGVMGLVPFGSVVANKLLELGILQDAFRMIDSGLTANNLTLDRIQREIDQAWNELSIDNGIDGNVAVITRHVDGLRNDALAFVRGILDQIVQLIRDAAVGLAETYLVGSPVWELTKKVLHHDPLRGTPVTAPTVEILADFLTLIGKQQALAQMQERGTLQKTADWLDVQVSRFMSLIAELLALFEAGWDAIQPENIANLADNLSKLARDAIGLVQRVGAFAGEVAATVLKLIKDALLDWLSREAAEMRGFRLLTVILGQDPFTGQAVARSAENLIGGFIALLPGGEETYRKLAEAGVIADAGAQIEGAMGRLGISLDMITGTFLSIWNSLSLEDLVNPVAAFMRVLDKFGEPLGRIVAFVVEVVKVVITLILKLMNFPSDLLGSIISNAMAAIEDIKRDPVAFLLNMIEALKAGFVAFLDKVLDYLLSGLADWLFRGLGAMGIQKPPDLSFKSILELVLQVLDITADKLWEKLGKHIGQDVVQKIRSGIAMAGEAFDFIKDVQENGVAAIWKHIESQLGNLWDTLLNMAKDWIVTTIIERATAKLLSMLDPTGIMAVVNSAIAFFNAVQSVIEYVREILAIVNDYVTTLAAVAAGNITAGAQKVERGLANAVPVAIGFLANQAGLGNVPEKLVELIGQLRELVDGALDWLFEQAMRLGRAALNALGMGGPAQADPAAAANNPDAINEPVPLGGVTHHLMNDGPGGALVLHSEPTLVNSIADPALQALVGRYNAATSVAAQRREAEAVARWIAANNPTGNPGGSAPGLGQVQRHGSKQSGLINTNVPLWSLQSEHVLPFDIIRGLWDVIGTHSHVVDRSDLNSEDRGLTTIMIYRDAAVKKDSRERSRRSQLANDFEAMGERYWNRPDAGEEAVEQVLRRWVLRALRREQSWYEDLTWTVVQEEHAEQIGPDTHGSRRAEAAPLPPLADIRSAAQQEVEDATTILDAAIAEGRRS